MSRTRQDYVNECSTDISENQTGQVLGWTVSISMTREFSYTFIFNLDRFELVAQEEDSEHFTQSFCATNILKQTDIVLYKKIKQHSKKTKTKLEQKTNYDY